MVDLQSLAIWDLVGGPMVVLWWLGLNLFVLSELFSKSSCSEFSYTKQLKNLPLVVHQPNHKTCTGHKYDIKSKQLIGVEM